ncbi:hypothetical protein CM15mP43_09690 [bacterium]|nr:MAG: hypothetical protein CM15mP43_09690 [bacterium]
MFKDGYHGDTLGAVSVGGIDIFHSTFNPLLFESIKISSYDSTSKVLDDLRKLLIKDANQIAALILEPYVQAAGGMKVAEDGYLKEIRKLCDEYDVLLILDEVATGFGRTGKMFACEHDNITPDILILGKGLTGGYLPLSATITTQNIFDAFLGDHDELKTFFHGHSYSGNPLSCAAAIANLEIFEKIIHFFNYKIKFNFLKMSFRSLMVSNQFLKLEIKGLWLELISLKIKLQVKNFLLKREWVKKFVIQL